MPETLVIPHRFRGPLRSANGGVVAGLLASRLRDDRGAVVEVTLRRPPPLGRPLAVEREGDAITLRDGEHTVAEARRATLDLAVPPPPTLADVDALAAAPAGWTTDAFGECFSCGVRADDDGLAIHPRPWHGLVVARWTPSEVTPEIVWAAIDCSGAYAVGGPGRGEPLLARMTATIARPPAVGEECVVVGWPIEEDGRKLHAGTALVGADGEILARSRQLWIVPASAASHNVPQET